MIVELYVMFVLNTPKEKFPAKMSFVEEQTVEQCQQKLSTMKELFKDSTTEIIGECIKWEDTERMPKK